MKKIIIIALAALGFAVAASAQSRAIGARIGYGGEISYQHNVGNNFAEFDLGFLGGYGFSIAGIYDFNIGQAGPVNFYAGPGAQLTVLNGEDALALGIAVAGQIGAEYQIPSVPINISLDWRPAFYITQTHFGWEGIALGIRYRF